jgi:hypothetical protein
VGSLLASFKAWGFYPEVTQGLLLQGVQRPGAFGPAEHALMAEVEAAVRRGRAHARWGVRSCFSVRCRGAGGGGGERAGLVRAAQASAPPRNTCA